MVLRGQAGLANRSGRYLPTVGHQPRGPLGMGCTWLGRRHWRQRCGSCATGVGRGPLAGALFFAVTLSPVLGFVNHGYMKYSFVADRFQYLAGIGVIAVLIGAAVHGAGRLPVRLKLGATGLLVGVAGASGNDDLAPGGNLSEQGHLLQPHRLSQPQGAERSLQSQHRVGQGRPSGGSPGRRPDGRGNAPGSYRCLCHPRWRAYSHGTVR